MSLGYLELLAHSISQEPRDSYQLAAGWVLAECALHADLPLSTEIRHAYLDGAYEKWQNVKDGDLHLRANLAVAHNPNLVVITSAQGEGQFNLDSHDEQDEYFRDYCDYLADQWQKGAKGLALEALSSIFVHRSNPAAA